MKTGELVDLLAADRVTAPAPRRMLLQALVPAAVLAAVLLALVAGLRPDLAQQLGNPRVWFKVSINVLLAVAAMGLLLRRAHPLDAAGPWRIMLGLVAALLVAAVIAELSVLPRGRWWEAARGRNATWCLQMIPMLATAPLVASLWMLRRAAPAHPGRAGTAAGLLSAALGGSLYALHCPDDSPLFVVLWYGLATAILAVAGALLGRRLLRW